MGYEIGEFVLDGWKIVREIGAGSFGRVYEIQKSGYGVKTVRSALKIICIPQSEAQMHSVYNEGLDKKSATSYFSSWVTLG